MPHLATKVVRKSSIRVENTEVLRGERTSAKGALQPAVNSTHGPTDVADTELLVARRSRCVGEVLQLALLVDLLALERLRLGELSDRLVDLSLGSCKSKSAISKRSQVGVQVLEGAPSCSTSAIAAW